MPEVVNGYKDECLGGVWTKGGPSELFGLAFEVAAIAPFRFHIGKLRLKHVCVCMSGRVRAYNTFYARVLLSVS